MEPGIKKWQYSMMEPKMSWIAGIRWNVEIWPNAADLAGFEMSRLARNWVWNQQKSWQKTFYFVNSAFSNVMRSAPKSPTPTFGPPLDASGSELSSAGRIIAARQTCEAVAPHFCKRDEMFEFWAKWVHKVWKSCRSTDWSPANLATKNVILVHQAHDIPRVEWSSWWFPNAFKTEISLVFSQFFEKSRKWASDIFSGQRKILEELL